MAMKRGRFGQFLACTGYPECKTTRKIITTKQGMTAAKPDQMLEEVPEVPVKPRAQAGALRRVHRVSNYPACKHLKQKSTGLVRPKERRRRGAKSRRGKVFYGCANYPDCDFVLCTHLLSLAVAQDHERVV